MNKSEFLKALQKQTPPSRESWQYDSGFNAYKEFAIKLALDLDDNGMTPETYNIFRDIAKEQNCLYKDVFALQREIATRNGENLKLYRENENLKRSLVPPHAVIEIVKQKMTIEQAKTYLETYYGIVFETEETK